MAHKNNKINTSDARNTTNMDETDMSFKIFQARKQEDNGEVSSNINSWLYSYWRILNPFSMLNFISTIEFL